jgi:beta-galactosidase
MTALHNRLCLATAVLALLVEKGLEAAWDQLAVPRRTPLPPRTALPAGGSPHTTRYTVHATGDIIVSNSFLPGKVGLPELLRFGMKMTLPAAFDMMTWLGRGPQESCCDSQTSAAVGLYSGTVADQYLP